jgi:hypothetical protein
MMRLEPIIARHHRDEVKAMYLAQAGLDKAYAELRTGSAARHFEEDLTDDTGTTVVGTYEVTAAGVFFFTFKGGDTETFYRYHAYENEWETKKHAPRNVKGGGALAWGGGRCIYGLRGGGTTNFDRYQLTTNTWIKRQSAPGTIGWGGALTHWYKYNETNDEYDHYLYATRGGGYSDFYLYNIDNNSWTTKANTPWLVDYGGALTWVEDEESAYSDYIYAFQGGNTKGFSRYKISTDAWENCPEAPYSVSYGGALAYAGEDHIYATRGGGYSHFYLYDIDDYDWYSKAYAPDTIGAGGSLVWSGGDYLYILRGSTSNTFWRYKISTNEWNPVPGDSPEITGGIPATTPGTIAAGGSLTRSGNLYWITSKGEAKDSSGRVIATKKIEAIIDTSVKAFSENRVLYYKEIPGE